MSDISQAHRRGREARERGERPQIMLIQQFPVGDIRVPEGRRRLHDLTALMQSIKETHLQHPISVTADGTLVAGYHRLEAVRELNRREPEEVEFQTITCHVLTLDKLRLELVEIEENLCREDLDDLERGEHVARQAEIYEALHPRAAWGGTGNENLKVGTMLPEDAESASSGSGNRDDPAPSFANYASARTGGKRATRTVQEDRRIGRQLSPETRDTLRGTKFAKKRHVLTSLAKLPAEEQLAKAKRLVAGESTPKEEGLGVIRRNPPDERKARERSPASRDRNDVVLPEDPEKAVTVLRRFFTADQMREIAFLILGDNDVKRVMFAVQKRYGREPVHRAYLINKARQSPVKEREEELQ